MPKQRCRKLTPAEKKLVYAPVSENAGAGWEARGSSHSMSEAERRWRKAEAAALDPFDHLQD